MEFHEGWRVWRIEWSAVGVPQLGPMYADSSYTLPSYFEENRAMARCILGCASPPGPRCRCGIRFYPHTGGLFDVVVDRLAQRRVEATVRGRSEWSTPIVVSYGRPVGPAYKDPKAGEHGSWGMYWRTGRYDIRALIGWPEYPMEFLGTRYGNIPTFTFDCDKSPRETLQQVARAVRELR